MRTAAESARTIIIRNFTSAMEGAAVNSPAKSSELDRRAFLKGAGIAAVAGIGSLAAPRSTRAASAKRPRAHQKIFRGAHYRNTAGKAFF